MTSALPDGEGPATRPRRPAFAAIALAALTFAVSGAIPTFAQEDRALVLTVLPFKTAAEPAHAYLGDSFSEALTTKLVGLKRVKIYERAQFDRLAAELRLEQDASGMFDAATLARTGAVVSIDYALMGSVTQAGGAVSCNVRLVHVNTGRVALAREIRGAFPADLFKVQDEAARAVAAALAITMDALELKRFSRAPTADQDAFQLYNRSLASVDSAERVKLLEAALGRDPGFAQAAHLLADAYVESGKPERAVPVYRRILDADPLDYRACYNLGLLVFDQGDYAGSRELARRCLAMKPGDPDAAYQLGLAGEFNAAGERYGAGCDLEAALASYQAAASMDPRHAESRLAGGMLSAILAQAEPDAARRLARLRSAAALLSECLALRPDADQAGELAANLELIRASIKEHEDYLRAGP